MQASVPNGRGNNTSPPLPPDHNVEDIVRRFHHPFCTVDTNTQDPHPLGIYSQAPNVCNPMCSKDSHSPHSPCAVGDGDKDDGWERSTVFVIGKGGS